MLMISNNDPSFAALKAMRLLTTIKDELMDFGEAEPLSLSKTDDGRLFIGDFGNVLEIVDKDNLSIFLANIIPATFVAGTDEEGCETMLVNPVEENISTQDLIVRIPKRIVLPESPIQVFKIIVEDTEI